MSLPAWLRATLDGLRRGEGTIRLHPEGFAQVNLADGGDLRLHVWDESIPRLADRDVVHDHVWDLESEVLVGRIENWRYAATESGDGDWELWEVTGRRSEGAGKGGAEGGNVIAGSGRLFHVDPVGGDFAVPGMTYRHERLVFHQSRVRVPTATIMRKSNKLEGAAPRVLARLGQSPDHFDDPGRPRMGERELWSAVDGVLGL